MLYTIEQLEKEVMGRALEVYEIFQNFFGEPFTDLQDTITPEDLHEFEITGEVSEDGVVRYMVNSEKLQLLKQRFSEDYCHIFVYWPYVTVTNEYDKSIDIQDLYAKIAVSSGGTIPYESHGFLLNRARYNVEQFNSGYMHSHVSSIPTENFSNFKRPCLGQGPINQTIASLRNDYDELTWMLFCQELAMYVTVESISGVPYNKLENVGARSKLYGYTGFTNLGPKQDVVNKWQRSFGRGEHKIRDFIKYYLEHGHLSIRYADGKFGIGMSYFDYIIDVSNSFIEYYNQLSFIEKCDISVLHSSNLIRECLASNNEFYDIDGISPGDTERYQGSHVLWFKGRDITLHIDEQEEAATNLTTVLDHNVAMHILYNIILIINYRYKNECKHRNAEEGTACISKNARYI